MSVRNWSSRISVHPRAKSSSCAHLTRRRGLLKVCDQTATLITPLYYVSLFKLHISNALCVCVRARTSVSVTGALLRCFSSNRMQFVAWKTNNSNAHSCTDTHATRTRLEPQGRMPKSRRNVTRWPWLADFDMETGHWDGVHRKRRPE